nr:AraC family transcriptional regulator [uncultured Flavobacterium sp.]
MDKIPVRHISGIVKEPELSGNFSIRKIEEVLSGGTFIQELHRHSFYFILIINQGSGEHIIDFTPYPVVPGSVFFMRPGQVHRLQLGHTTTGYLIQFNNEFYNPQEKTSRDILNHLGNRTYCKLNEGRFLATFAILQSIYDESAVQDTLHQQAIQSWLDLLLIDLFRQGCNCGNCNQNRGDYAYRKLEELVSLVNTHLAENKQVNFYADKMNLTPYQLNAVIKTTIGKTFSGLVTDTVMLEAKRQLLATSNQINHIALDLGYEDVSYFIRFFKKHTGHSPEAFRNNFK